MSARSISQGSVRVIGAEGFAAAMDELGAAGTGNAGLDKAMSRAISSAVKKYVMPQLYEVAKREYTAKQGALEGATKIKNTKAYRGTGRVLKVTGNRLQLVRFDVNPTSPPPQRGVRVADRIPGPIVTVRQGRLPSLLRGVIVAKMDSGHIGYFERLPGTKARPKALPSGRVVVREKIHELISLSMAEMIRAHGIGASDEKAQKEIREAIYREIAKSVNKAKTRYAKKIAKGEGL